jgi:hypothetical protein
MPAVLAAASLLACSCATVSPLLPPATQEAECQRLFEGLDRLTETADARSAGTVPVAGAPYLRTNRFLASLAGEPLSPEAHAAWLERLRATDERERVSELANLGPAARSLVPPIPGLSQREALRECGLRLVDRDLHSPGRLSWIKGHATVPDSYSRWRRILGAYPLTRWIFGEAVSSLHRERRAAFSKALVTLPRRGRVIRYMPPGGEPLTHDDVRRILDESSDNPLRMPEPVHEDLVRLFEAFAPAWEIDTIDENDRPGLLRWNARGHPEVDTAQPSVYRFVSHTRFGTERLLQLNYLVWFPSRPSTNSVDIHAGRLDGLIWRVTLSPDGRPLAYDTIHACGCYYQVYPGIGFRVAQPTDDSEPVLSPYPVGPPSPGDRLVISVAGGRHWVEAVDAARRELDESKTMRWHDYKELLSLRNPHGGYRSLFGTTGLIAGTQRIERWLLWPSGIESPGAMREPGTHAIALVGRRHFDDAWLFDRLIRRL